MTPAIDAPRLLGDVGGTNARFAWQAARGAAIEQVVSYPCEPFGSLEEVLRHYLNEHAPHAPRQAAIGIANPVQGDEVRMTNRSWHFSTEALRRSLGLDRLVVLNDFAALALALPTLQPSELRRVGGGEAVARGALALIGPGTGLGVAGLVFDPAGHETVVSGEGGHVSLAAADDEQTAVLGWLRREFGHVSAERALSGPGLENLYRAWVALHGRGQPPLSASAISQRALAGSDAACVSALDLFLALLGNVAGNLALTIGATGGLYIGGGIVPRLGAAIERSRFRQQFEAKGRFSDYLRRVPVQVIDSSEWPSLRGAARSLDRP